MDGYIKNKRQAIRSVWSGIVGKYSIVAIPLILLCILLLFSEFVAHQNPKRWKEETVRFAGFGEMWLLLNRNMSDALITEDGREFHTGSAERLQNALVVGEEYTIVYSSNLKGKVLEGLSKDGTVYIDVNDSAKAWREAAAYVLKITGWTVAVMTVAILLIDRLWCKKEHAQIRKLKAEVARREMRIRNNKSGGQ